MRSGVTFAACQEILRDVPSAREIAILLRRAGVEETPGPPKAAATPAAANDVQHASFITTLEKLIPNHPRIRETIIDEVERFPLPFSEHPIQPR